MPDVLSPASGREAFTALKDRIAATKPNKTRTITLSEAARRGVELAGLLVGPDVASQLASLEATGLLPGLADDLRLASHAIFYRASIREHIPTATGLGPRVPVELWDEVLVVRRDLLDTLSFGLRSDARAQDVLARVRPGNGYLDHAQDLTTLADLAREHATAFVAAMPGHFDPASIATAEVLSTAMLDELGLTKDEVADDLDQRAWSLFQSLFGEARAALTFLWRNEPESFDRVPTLGTRRTTPQTPRAPAEPLVHEAPTAVT